MPSVEGWVAIMTGVLGVLLYLIRSEIQSDVSAMRTEVARVDGRINTHEEGCTVRQGAIEHRLTTLDQRSERIEDKLDRVLEGR